MVQSAIGEVERGEDARIEWSVLHALRRDPDVRQTEIGVEVREGVITLFGVVPTPDARRAVLDAVARVGGLRAVEDRLKVRPL